VDSYTWQPLTNSCQVSAVNSSVLQSRSRVEPTAVMLTRTATSIGRIELDYMGTSPDRANAKYWGISTTTVNTKLGDFTITASASAFDWQVPVEGLYWVTIAVSLEARTATFELWGDLCHTSTWSSGESTARSYVELGTHNKRYIGGAVPYYPYLDGHYCVWLRPGINYCVVGYHTDSGAVRDFSGRCVVRLLRERASGI
jgi:hypothetical protein